MEIGDRWGTARALDWLSGVAGSRGEYAVNKQLLEESLAIYQEIADQYGMASALNRLSVVNWHLGEYQEARRYLLESLAVLQPEASGQRATVYAHHKLGLVACALEEYEQADGHFQKALRTAMEPQMDPLVLRVLAGMARLSTKTGDQEQALPLLELALHHPASDQETRDAATRLLAELTVQPTDRGAEGQTRPLEEVVAEMLKKH